MLLSFEGGVVMGLFSNLFSDKTELLNWQNVILLDKKDRLIMSRKQLESSTIQAVQNDARIFDDCGKLINSTTKPDVFFSRLELAEQKLGHLVSLEPYLKNVKSLKMSVLPSKLMK